MSRFISLVLFAVVALLAVSSSTKSLHAARQYIDSETQSTSVSTRVSSYSEFVEGWQVVPTAFGTCLAAFRKQVTVQVAVQEVKTLYSRVTGVMNNFGSCGACGGVSAAHAYSSRFSSIVKTTFTEWQSILQTGQSLYAGDWQPQFVPLFRQFNPFLTVVKQNAGLFGLDLSSLLGGLLNVNLFSGCGLSIGGLLGGALNVVGGLVGGLLGGH